MELMATLRGSITDETFLCRIPDASASIETASPLEGEKLTRNTALPPIWKRQSNYDLLRFQVRIRNSLSSPASLLQFLRHDCHLSRRLVEGFPALKQRKSRDPDWETFEQLVVYRISSSLRHFNDLRTLPGISLVDLPGLRER